MIVMFKHKVLDNYSYLLKYNTCYQNIIKCNFIFFQSGQLNEYTERKDMSCDVVCMALANVPVGEQRSRFLAVGLADNTVRIISLDPNVSPCDFSEIFLNKLIQITLIQLSLNVA